MNLIKHLKWGVLAGLLAMPLSAGDFDDVLKALKQAWPDRTSIGIICNVDANQLALMDLGDTAKTLNISLIIMNVKKIQEVKSTITTLLSKNPGVLLIIDDDEFLGVRSRETARCIHLAASRKVPAIAISEDGLKAGALFAVGPATKGKILTNPKAAERMGLPLPDDVPAIQVETPK